MTRRPSTSTATSSSSPTTIEDVRGTEVLSLGRSLEIIKDLGDAETVAGRLRPERLRGHARDRPRADGDRVRRRHRQRPPLLGLSRSPTSPSSTTASSPTTTSGAGAWSAPGTASSRSATRRSSPSTSPSGWPRATRSRTRCAAASHELDGVFTYICVTEDALGVAKDELGAKPLVLYESDDIVALASEEIAIRKVVDREIETYDPYEGEVMVWTRLSAAPRRRPRARRARRHDPEDLRRSTASAPCSTRATCPRARSTPSCAGCSTSRASRT